MLPICYNFPVARRACLGVPRTARTMSSPDVPSKWWSGLWIVAGLLLITDWSLTPLIGVETDVWWHLASGRRFFEHGLELTDPFSSTFADQFWIRIDWLFQVALYGLYSVTGLGGLLLARCLVFGLSAGLLMAALRSQGIGWGRSGLVVLLTAWIWSQSAGLRPATLSTLFTCLWVFLLEEARQGKTRRLWLLPPLMTLWYNFHVAALAGVLLLAVYAWGQWVDWRALRGPPPSRLWWAMIPATLAAALITPQPGKLLYYPIHFLIFKSPWNQIIQEVQPSRWDMAGTPEARLLLLLAALGALQGLRRRSTTGLWVWLVCGYLMNATYRHQFQLCSVLAPLAGSGLQHSLRGAARGGRVARLGLACLAAILSLRSLLSLAVCKLPPSGLLRRESYPQAQAAWIHGFAPGTRVFADMNTAGYFLWIFAGEQKLFIDSRTDQVYSRPSFVGEYFEVLLGRGGALSLLDRYQIDVVTLQNLVSGPFNPEASGLDQRLCQSPDWGAPAYQDSIGRVYLRAGKRPPAQLPVPPAYLSSYLEGLALYRSGRGSEGLARLQDSLADYPQFPYAHQALARIWMDRGQTAEARRQLARAELFHPDRAFVQADWQRWAAQSGQALWVDWPTLRRFWLPLWAL